MSAPAPSRDPDVAPSADPAWDWDAVSWGHPEEPPAETCSYCATPIGDDDVPLTMWNGDDRCARFCIVCQWLWQG